MCCRGTVLFALVFSALPFVLPAQSICVPTTNAPIVRIEGITERIGEVVLSCSGAPNSSLTANFTVALDTNVTNQISNGNSLNGMVFTIDSGSGPQPVLIQPLLSGQNAIFYNGVNVPFSTQGNAILRFSGIRANATPGAPISASLAVTGANFELPRSQFAVGTPLRGLFVGYSTALVCAQNGSPLPSTIGFANLIAAGTTFASTRVTEGFADAFQPLPGFANFNGQTGERFLVQYSGFPTGSRLFVPDVVAGSDALQPTAGGDLELPASGGSYAPSLSGSLLLARVAERISMERVVHRCMFQARSVHPRLRLIRFPNCRSSTERRMWCMKWWTPTRRASKPRSSRPFSDSRLTDRAEHRKPRRR